MQLSCKHYSNQGHADVAYLPWLPLAEVNLLNIQGLRIRVQPDFHNLSHPASRKTAWLDCLLL